MKGLKLNGKSVADADLVAISSCISKIEKLSGIEKISLALNSRVEIPLLVEIVKKMDEPVIMEVNLMYIIINYFFLLIIIFNISQIISSLTKNIALSLYKKNYGRHFQVYWESSAKTSRKIFLRDCWEKEFRKQKL